ncbi:condensation domain-containing protein [Streptomyces sp. NPDC053048]|uniref:condensation domain-containing protein n=1 Tax=Streptomyces sp. NPDC053048 TaxID=3365694 RepID=UPI0037D67F93
MTVDEKAATPSGPDGPEKRIPLSFHQEFLCMFDGGDDEGPFGPRYHIVGAWHLTGELDVPSLQSALDDVVARHEALRTEIVRDGSAQHQRIVPPAPAALEVRDLAGTAEADRERRAEDLLNEVESGTVPIGELPLLRAVVGRFDARDAVLALVAHHTAADAWSMHVIMRDLMAFYAARRDGTAPALPTVPQYQDYARWERERAEGAAAARSRAYWREKLSGAQVHALPTDRARSEKLPKATAWHRFGVEPELGALVGRLAEDTKSSPFMILLAAYKVQLSRLTGATDIVVPTFSAGRGQERFQETVGSFINFLPLRTDLAGCESFRQVVERVRRTCLEAYSHEIPFGHVVAGAPELMVPAMADDGQVSAFQAAIPPFAEDGGTAGDVRYSKIWKRVLSQPVGSDVPDGVLWTLHLDHSGDMAGSLGFNTNRLRPDTMDGLLADYLGVLRTVVTTPDEKVLL